MLWVEVHISVSAKRDLVLSCSLLVLRILVPLKACRNGVYCMSQDVPDLSTLPYRLHITPPRTHLHMKFIQLFCSLFLSLLLFSNILGGWASPLSYAFAAGNLHSHGIPGSLTLRKFLQQGRADHVYHGPFLRPKHPTQVPTDTRHGQP